MINFAIGTAQFGQDYGICNDRGAVEGDNATSIVKTALDNNIHIFDTASMYGDSETVLGKALPSNQTTRIITKYYVDENDIDGLLQNLEESQTRLGKNNIDGILIHNADVLKGKNGQKIWDTLKQTKEENNVHKIGVSVYTPDDFTTLTNQYDIDLVQAPCNLLDQRFLSDAVQSVKKEKNIELHARSLFLQGLLLQELDALPEQFKEKREHFLKTQKYTRTHNLSSLELCLLFAQWAQENSSIDHFVIGVDSGSHLQEIVKVVQDLAKHEKISHNDIKTFETDDLSVIDPRQWKRD